jgi:hypothetical protein
MLQVTSIISSFAYNGPDKLQIDNDISFTISHIGYTTFTLYNIFIQLNNILHVPNFYTNLISLSKLLKDNLFLSNNFSFSSYIIKDIHIKISPLHILNHKGLHSLKVKSSLSVHHESPLQAFLGTHTSSSMACLTWSSLQLHNTKIHQLI